MDSGYQNRLTDFVKRARPLLVSIAKSASVITQIYIPAMFGVDGSDVLFNFGSKPSVPATQGLEGEGVTMYPDKLTGVEGWGLVPSGAKAATIYAILENQAYTGGMRFQQIVELETLGVGQVQTNGDWTTLTNSDFGGQVAKLLPLEFDVAAEKMIHAYLYRDGYDGADTETKHLSCYGWIVNFS